MKTHYIAYLLAFVVLTGCVEPYPPPIIDEEVNFLVVDGFVNVTEGNVQVKLSRAVALSATLAPPPEHHATIYLEDNNGGSTILSETEIGVYTATGLSLDTDAQYKLNIQTESLREYESDYITIKNTPPIDSVTWEPSGDGVTFFVNTHDATNQTRYYQWTFVETWEYNSVYDSYLRYDQVEDTIVVRQQNEYVYKCWKSENSHRILINSSEKLSSDIVHEFPLTLVENGSSKMFLDYSILVKQFALTREAYDYYEKLQKTTESLGGLFDPQPGRLNGNIHSVSDPGEFVLGYFSGASVQEKRIFVKLRELPDYLRHYQTVGTCSYDTLFVGEEDEFSYYGNELMSYVISGPAIIGYYYAPSSCVDCRLRGGSTTKPVFWE